MTYSKEDELEALDLVRKYLPDINLTDDLYCMDELDFIEIIMQFELEFNAKINESEYNESDIVTVKDFIQWMFFNGLNKTPKKEE